MITYNLSCFLEMVICNTGTTPMGLTCLLTNKIFLRTRIKKIFLRVKRGILKNEKESFNICLDYILNLSISGLRDDPSRVP